MNTKKAGFYNIIISIIFAGIMIISSYVLLGTAYQHYSQPITILLIGLWWIPFSFLNGLGKKSTCN